MRYAICHNANWSREQAVRGGFGRLMNMRLYLKVHLRKTEQASYNQRNGPGGPSPAGAIKCGG